MLFVSDNSKWSVREIRGGHAPVFFELKILLNKQIVATVPIKARVNSQITIIHNIRVVHFTCILSELFLVSFQVEQSQMLQFPSKCCMSVSFFEDTQCAYVSISCTNQW